MAITSQPPDPPDGRSQTSKPPDLLDPTPIPTNRTMAPLLSTATATRPSVKSPTATALLTNPVISTSRSTGGPNSSHSPPISYANVVAGSRPSSIPTSGTRTDAAGPSARTKLKPRFPPLSLPPRQVGIKDGKPSISFSGSEIVACEKRFEHSIIAKFTFGRPYLAEIQKVFLSSWCISGRVSISEIWDNRHVLVIFDSEEDVRAALSSPLNKVGRAFFRLFRWSPDYNPKMESTVTTIWVRLPGLPLSLYDSSFVEAIISTIGYFVSVDDRTKTCTCLKFARACVELDVTKPIPQAIWIDMPDNRSYWQSIEVESKLDYCTKCRIHGHSFESCRKRRSKEPIMKTKDVHPKANEGQGVVVGVDEQNPPAGDHASNMAHPLMGEQSDLATYDTDSQSRLALVVYNEPVDDDSVISNITPAPAPESRDMVIYEEVTETSSTLAQDDPEWDLSLLKKGFDLVKNELAAEGYSAFPDRVDDDFVAKLYKALSTPKDDRVIPESNSGNETSTISEWIPVSNKKKKKGKPGSTLDVRRSDRPRQSTEVKNPDFIYHSKGL